MRRGTPLACAALIIGALGACSTNSSQSSPPASAASASTTAPSTSTAASATVTPASSVATGTPTAAPTTTARASTTAPNGTGATGAAHKVVIQAAGFLIPQGEYSFEDAPDDTVASWQSLLDASRLRAQSGTIGGVDVYDNTGQDVGRLFLFVADEPLAADAVADLQTYVAADAEPAPEPATMSGATGVTWSSGGTFFFLGEHTDTIIWVLAKSADNLEPSLAHLLESLGG